MRRCAKMREDLQIATEYFADLRRSSQVQMKKNWEVSLAAASAQGCSDKATRPVMTHLRHPTERCVCAV